MVNLSLTLCVGSSMSRFREAPSVSIRNWKNELEQVWIYKCNERPHRCLELVLEANEVSQREVLPPSKHFVTDQGSKIRERERERRYSDTDRERYREREERDV